MNFTKSTSMMRRSLQLVRKYSLGQDVPNPGQHSETKLVGPNLKTWLYERNGFCKYGLMRDDLLHETPIVEEALRRLPADVMDARVFRIVRAGYMCLRKDILPKEQWTKLEDDVLYLTPLVKEVEKELEEKKNWDE